MQKLVRWLAPALGIVAVIFAIALGNNAWPVIAYRSNMPVEGGKVAGALFVVAVFLERALSVINDLLFGEETVDAKSKLRVALQSPDTAGSQNIASAFWELEALADDKQRLRLGVGFLASVFIAGAGVRTFSGLLTLDALGGNQRILLDTMDILLTAGLLAGGSNGLALIIEALRNRNRLWEMPLVLPGQIDENARLRMARAGLKSSTASTTDFESSVAGLPPQPVINADVADLDLAEHAKTAAIALQAQFPGVVFTSGRRTVAQQANAMAGNIVKNRNWIKETYAESTERDTLQTWVDDNPAVTTKAGIAAGLSAIMTEWTETQLVKLSRHFNGLAFDVQPTSDTKLKDAIKGLPNLVKFLDSEGGQTIWHAEFKKK